MGVPRRVQSRDPLRPFDVIARDRSTERRQLRSRRRRFLLRSAPRKLRLPRGVALPPKVGVLSGRRARTQREEEAAATAGICNRQQCYSARGFEARRCGVRPAPTASAQAHARTYIYLLAEQSTRREHDATRAGKLEKRGSCGVKAVNLDGERSQRPLLGASSGATSYLHFAHFLAAICLGCLGG